MVQRSRMDCKVIERTHALCQCLVSIHIRVFCLDGEQDMPATLPSSACILYSVRIYHRSRPRLHRICARLLWPKSRIPQLLEELIGESRINEFQKLGNLLPVLREMQDERVFIRVRSNIAVCCARRMHNTRMRIYIMHLCVDSNLG